MGFEWWTGSWGQWLFIAMTVLPVVAAAFAKQKPRLCGRGSYSVYTRREGGEPSLVRATREVDGGSDGYPRMD